MTETDEIRKLSEKLWDSWESCEKNQKTFFGYMNSNTLALQNLAWLYHHEKTRQYLTDTLSRINPGKNRIAYGCVARIKDLFDLDININGNGDADALWDFVEVGRSLLAEARADLYKNGEMFFEFSFEPLELYLAELESGTFGFSPLKDGGVDDERASWQK